jgi:hypothetical protein
MFGIPYYIFSKTLIQFGTTLQYGGHVLQLLNMRHI